MAVKDGKEFKEDKIPSKEIKALTGDVYTERMNTHNLATRQGRDVVNVYYHWKFRKTQKKSSN